MGDLEVESCLRWGLGLAKAPLPRAQEVAFQLAQNWIRTNFDVYSQKSAMYEKVSWPEPSRHPQGVPVLRWVRLGSRAQGQHSWDGGDTQWLLLGTAGAAGQAEQLLPKGSGCLLFLELGAVPDLHPTRLSPVRHQQRWTAWWGRRV